MPIPTVDAGGISVFVTLRYVFDKNAELKHSSQASQVEILKRMRSQSLTALAPSRLAFSQANGVSPSKTVRSSSLELITTPQRHRYAIQHPPSFPTHLPIYPSTSLLLPAKNSANHSKGFSGSYIAKCFIPSSKCGVTFPFRYCLVGPPCATGFSGRAEG